MKKLLAIIAVASFATLTVAAEAPVETKKACVTQKDAKTGKEKEVCKTVKIHKKHEGTKVEGATKDSGKK